MTMKHPLDDGSKIFGTGGDITDPDERYAFWEGVALHDAEMYKVNRRQAYPDLGEQLDYIYHNGVDAWKADIIDPIKAQFPKPSEEAQ